MWEQSFNIQMHRARTAHKRVPHTCIACNYCLEITVNAIGNVGYADATN